MTQIHKSVIIIGGGPGGLAAAIRLKENGIQDILILEREQEPGGILRQCIHDGFGLTRFKQSLSGPEYAQRFIDRAKELGIECITDATVIRITENRLVTAASPKGLLNYQADAIILSMGCRERTRGALSIPGERPSGVFTAGVAQTYINLKNKQIGSRAVILGSGDIGMIMARRLTLEGVKVEAVFEILPYPSGLPRNVEQCLNDYNIPLLLSHTITDIKGRRRLESVTVSQVDEHLIPIPGTEAEYPCDTLILSVGLIPENELSSMAGVELDPRTKGAAVDEYYRTSVPGIFAAGNVLHVHDLVDFVSMEAERLADCVTQYLTAPLPSAAISLEPKNDISYTVPQKITGTRDVLISFRPKKPFTDGWIELWQDDRKIAAKEFSKIIPAKMENLFLPKKALLSRSNIKVVIKHD